MHAFLPVKLNLPWQKNISQQIKPKAILEPIIQFQIGRRNEWEQATQPKVFDRNSSPWAETILVLTSDLIHSRVHVIKMCQNDLFGEYWRNINQSVILETRLHTEKGATPAAVLSLIFDFVSNSSQKVCASLFSSYGSNHLIY